MNSSTHPRLDRPEFADQSKRRNIQLMYFLMLPPSTSSSVPCPWLQESMLELEKLI